MNILITNLILTGNTGTEMYVIELAVELKKRGHSVEVFTLNIGKSADLLRSHDINIVNRLKSLKKKPDIIHAHHNIVTALAASYFRNTPIVFFVHDRTACHDYPFTHRNIIKYLAVDYNCRERYFLETNFSDQNDVQVIFNWYNSERFKLKEIINDVPQKALIFSNYMRKDRVFDSINSACFQLNIKLDIVGANSGKSIMNPENILADYDIVFAKAKAGIEALSTGASLIVCDFMGLAGMVLTENVERYRNYNFGMKLMTRSATTDLIVDELKKYNSKETLLVSKYVRQNANFTSIVTQLEELYLNSINEYKLIGRGKYGYSLHNHCKIIFMTRDLYLFPRILRMKFFKVLINILKTILHPIRKSKYNNNNNS